jgi:preprotein translocase subunit SecD
MKKLSMFADVIINNLFNNLIATEGNTNPSKLGLGPQGGKREGAGAKPKKELKEQMKKLQDENEELKVQAIVTETRIHQLIREAVQQALARHLAGGNLNQQG